MNQVLGSLDFWRLGMLGLYIGAVLLMMFHMRLPAARESFLAMLQGAAQLAIMGSVLLFVFEVDHLALSVALLVVMVLVASRTAARRIDRRAATFRFALGCIGLATLAILLPMALARVFELRPNFLIPISGMVIGNAMNATALALERLRSDLKLQRDRVEAWLSLGADPDTAMRSSARSTLEAALIPSLNSLKTTGVVHIPGMMTGMLLGGQSPVKAAEMQLTILVLIFTAALFSALLVTRLARRLFFTELEALDLPD
jgi:putative ABC transport system permease protein